MNNISEQSTRPEAVTGYCRSCKKTHRLPGGSAFQQAQRLMTGFEENESIALDPAHIDSPLLSTKALFGEARGKMFGVLECLNAAGKQIWLYAFSGQYNGSWSAPGWVPPLFDIDHFHQLNDPAEKQIKELSRKIEAVPSREVAAELKSERTWRCRQLMKSIHDLYVLNNYRDESVSLDEAIGSAGNKPTGIGDCCAPKLLNYAATNRLKPVSMVEFYFGRPNRSHSKRHKQFYPPCTDKCGPLLGFLLCGIT